MAYVYGVAFTFLFLLVCLPGLLVTINLLLERLTDRTYTRLRWTPVQAFLVGLPAALVLTVWIGGASNAGATVIAVAGAAVGLSLLAVGLAALARLLGERMADWTGSDASFKNLVRGAVVLSLAVIFPIAGWFVFLPLVGITAIGASLFGLVGWLPRRKMGQAAPPDQTLAAGQTR